jgi:hypothetical protein
MGCMIPGIMVIIVLLLRSLLIFRPVLLHLCTKGRFDTGFGVFTRRDGGGWRGEEELPYWLELIGGRSRRGCNRESVNREKLVRVREGEMEGTVLKAHPFLLYQKYINRCSFRVSGV